MEEIINYLNKTPENTNPNVLRDMVSSGSSSGSNSGNLFLVTMDADSGESDKTFQETYDAFIGGENVIIYWPLDNFYETITGIMIDEDNNIFMLKGTNNSSMYIASTKNSQFGLDNSSGQ